MDVAVAARDVRRTYGETVALAGVSLEIERGSIFGLIGPNGAGKTTLVRALTGTTSLDSGAVELLGTAPTDCDRERIGVLPQSFAPPERLTVDELLTYYGRLYDEAREPDRVRREVGLEGRGDVRYEDLSGGQQRRLCVGVTIVNDPAVLVLDEPTTGIDPAGRQTVWSLVVELAAGGTTVVLTTHDMAEATHLSDRVGLLSDGELIATGTPHELVAEHGGESQVVVTTTAPVEDFVEAPWRVRSGGGETVVLEDVPAEDLGEVVGYLEADGIPYRGVAWAEPDLEDVYLRLAGDRERDRTGITEVPT